HAVDLSREPVEMDLPPVPRRGRHGLVVDLAEALGHDGRAVRSAAGAVARTLPGAIARAVTDPSGAVREVAATTTSLVRFVRPVTGTRSQIMADRRLQWHYELLDVPLAPLK